MAKNGFNGKAMLAPGTKSAKSCEMNPHRRLAAGVMLLLLASCSSNASAPSDHHDHDTVDTSEVVYVGAVTDEALEQLLAVTPKDDPRYAVVIDSPDLTRAVPKESAANFEFHSTTPLALAPNPPPTPAVHPRSPFQRSFHEFLRFISPERVAHAHGEPYNGPAYYLVFSDADAKVRLQVFTNKTSFTPEAIDWENLVQAPQPLTLQIISAVFEENDIPADSGPYAGVSTSFRIE